MNINWTCHSPPPPFSRFSHQKQLGLVKQAELTLKKLCTYHQGTILCNTYSKYIQTISKSQIYHLYDSKPGTDTPINCKNAALRP